MKYDNIAYKVMAYLGNITGKDMVQMFGEEDGTSLWAIYKIRYHGNPWLWFMNELTEEMMDKVTFNAMTYPIVDAPMDGCFNVDWWASYKACQLVNDLVKDDCEIVLKDEVLHDFPMKNGYFQTAIKTVYRSVDGDLMVSGMYQDAIIRDYFSSVNSVVEQLKLYRAILKSIKNED